MHLKKILLGLLLVGVSPMAPAMLLGEGQILNHVGEPFSANIALVGSYSRDVKFFQVRSNECQTSIAGANGCDSIYDGHLSFAVKQRPDGQYFLRVTGPRGSELFYRILIKSSSPEAGTVYNTFDFLPEFRPGADVQLPVTYDADVPAPAGKYGIVGGNVVEVVQEEAAPARSAAPLPVKPPEAARQKRADVPVKKPVESHLQIKKIGEYADDIHALQKENGEIEEQIALLEKHIGLLKEVIRLKTQVEAVPVPAAPVRLPVTVPLPQSGNESGLLTWILLAVVVVMSALVAWMFLKIKRLSLSGGGMAASPVSPSPLNEMKPLDLTGPFVKPKW